MPRTVTTSIEVYTARELQKLFPSAFEKAANLEGDNAEEMDSEDIAASFKGLFAALSGVCLKDWGFSSYGRDNRCRVEFTQYEAGDLSGKRAASWFENNLFADLRTLPGIGEYKSGGRARHFYDWGKEAAAKHFGGKRYSRHGAMVGAVAYCPFTGVCYDEDLIAHIRKGIRSGESVREILEGLADKCGEMVAQAGEGAREPKNFIETADTNGWEFDEYGNIV